MRICVREIPIRAFLVRFGGISGSFGLAMGILARPNSPDILLKRTKKVRLGTNT